MVTYVSKLMLENGCHCNIFYSGTVYYNFYFWLQLKNISVFIKLLIFIAANGIMKVGRYFSTAYALCATA